MKKTQLKDARRNIKKQIVSFLSIVVIAALGVTMFLGLNYSAEAISRNGSSFYDGAGYRDVEIISTRMLSPEDMALIRETEGVRDVEGVLMTQAGVSSDVTRKTVNVVTASERINVPVVVEGRMPEAVRECAVEKSLADQMGWKTGDTIAIKSTKGSTARFLRDTEFVITGVATHPDHVCGTVPDTLYIFVAPGEFDLDVFEGSVMKAEIALESPAAVGRFKDAYKSSVAPVLQSIRALGEERAPIREKEVDTLVREAAEKRLNDGWEIIEQVKEDVREKIRAALVERLGEELGEQLVSAIDWAVKKVPDLNDVDATASFFRITENVSLDLRLTPEENLKNVIETIEIPDWLLKQAFERLNGEGEYTAEKSKELIFARILDLENLEVPDEVLEAAFGILEGEGAYTPEKAKELISGTIDALKEQYGSDYEALAAVCTEWDENHMKYLDGRLWKELGLSGQCRWIVTDVRGNLSFVQLSASRDSLVRMQMTFSLLFVVVGALVIYATVSKQVDEQRTLIGTTKALGFYRREIFFKYLTFGVSATLLGTVLGILIARFAVQPFILHGYQIYYTVDITKPAMTVLPTLAVLAAGTLLAFCAVWFATRRLLKTPAVALMLPEAPKGRNKSGKGKKNMLPLYSRLILRNVRSDLKRVIVTIVSVAGCCSLIVIGFTLNRSVNNSVKHQFSDVVQNDGLVRFDPQADPDSAQKVGAILTDAGAATCPVTDTYITVSVRDLNVEELYCGDLAAINEMFRLNDAKTGAPLELRDDGIYIPKRFSEFFGVNLGEMIEITVNGTETARIRVAGVFENYMNSIMIMSGKCYEDAFGYAPDTNAYLVRLNGAGSDALEAELRTVPGYLNYAPSDSFRKLFKAATSVMGAVVALFIFMAGVMAGVVVMNLTNIYFMQKKRELTIMRVNGFTAKEAIGYVLRETIVTTALGIVLGIGLGAGLGYAIVRALEPPFVQFDRSVSVLAWILAALITLVFATVINFIVLRKVRNLKLTDVA